MTKDEALKLALEALECALSDDKPYIVQCKEAITAIKEALAQPEPEYLAFMDTPQRKPLTDEEIERNWQFLYDEEGNPPDHHDFARAIEAEHGIKG